MSSSEEYKLSGNYIEDTQYLALKAATLYYDNVLMKGKYPGDFNRFKGVPKETAVRQLARENIGKLREVIPADMYDENMVRRANTLDHGAIEKYMFEFGDEPFGATRKKKFDDVMDEWYKWGPKETEARMYDFGYDPAKKGDREAFLKELSENQAAHDRAGIVKETVEDAGPVTKLGFLAYPSLYNESVKQSLTGNFDDDKMDRALLTDVGVGSAMALNPFFKVLENPIAIGLADAGLESFRQGVNYAEGREVDPMAPVTTGTMAATVPALAKGAQGFTSQIGSMESRPLTRGFARGARGALDPVEEERNALKQMLINAKKQSDAARTGVDPNFGRKKNVFVGAGDVTSGDAWKTASDKLKLFGYEDKELVDETRLALDNAKAKLATLETQKRNILRNRNIPWGEREVAVMDIDKELVKVQNEFDEAFDAHMAASMPMKTATKDMGPVQKVIGRDPSKVKRTSPAKAETSNPITMTLNRIKEAKARDNELEAVLKRTYDQPQNYGQIPQFADRKAAVQTMMAQFPAKTQMEIGKGGGATTKAAYNLGLLGGRTASTIGASFEPNMKINPWAIDQYDEKLKNFRESEWYKNLPQEKKNIIEKVLKGE